MAGGGEGLAIMRTLSARAEVMKERAIIVVLRIMSCHKDSAVSRSSASGILKTSQVMIPNMGRRAPVRKPVRAIPVPFGKPISHLLAQNNAQNVYITCESRILGIQVIPTCRAAEKEHNLIP